MKLIKSNYQIKQHLDWMKNATVFDYIDKVLIVLSAKSGGVCIISYMSAVGIAEAFFL